MTDTGLISVPPSPVTVKHQGYASPDRPTTAGPDSRDSWVSYVPDDKPKFYPPALAKTPAARIFLFVNPTSGGNAAGAFTRAGLCHAFLSDPDMELYIADIRDGNSGDKPAFKQLKVEVDNRSANEKIIAVMAGGDGTVLWGISELWEHLIDDSAVVVGVIPYGTGNDFARALRWNSIGAINPFHDEMKTFKTIAQGWLSAPVKWHDIWSIDFEVAQGGQFKQIDSKTRKKKVLVDKIGQPITILKKKLNNYFSLGVESRIGIGFDRHRKRTPLGNKIVYVNEGIKKTVFHRTRTIQSLLVKMTSEQSGTVFKSEPGPGEPSMCKAASLIALNIPSFASGLDIWRHASRIGLELGASSSRRSGCIPTRSVRNDDFDNAVEQLRHARQEMGDGKLEWVCFSGISALGTEQIVEGLGKRLHQGGGPFQLSFRNDLPSKQRVYFQIDGEFFQVTQPLEIKISLFRKIKCLSNVRQDSITG